MRLNIILSFVAVCSVLPNRTALAQIGGGDTALEELRKRNPAGDNDNTTIDRWLADRFDQDTFLADVAAVRDDTATTAAFRAALADRLNAFAGAKLAQPGATTVEGAVRLVRALIDIDHEKTQRSLTAALEHPQEAVRYLGAKGLQSIRDRIVASTNPNDLRDFVVALKKAALAETSNVVIDRICRAIAIPNSDEAKTAVIEVFQSQADRYRKGAILADRTEVGIVGFLSTANLDQGEMATAVQSAAVMLRLDARRYADGHTNGFAGDEQAIIEQRVATLETWLEQVVRPASGAAGNMKKAMGSNDPQTLGPALEFELNKWIGTEQTAGVLNGPPWNVPVSAP